ncbi:MAG: hypothetical protein U9P11_01870 [Pseudomonadota bacterium]|nr:hypothetical protein [Pseudomonadota bacterium]
MTIIYDMANGSIESEQGQENSTDNGSEARPEAALRMAVQEFRTAEMSPPKVPAHLIRAFTTRD